MRPRLNKRGTVRSCRPSPIIIENEKSGRVFRGMINKYSRSGLYFESDYPLLPGTVIKLRSTFLRAASSGFFLAEVKLCEKIKDPLVLLQYGISARFCADADYKKFVRRGLRVIRGGKKVC
jgi:hypothetical protein